MGCNNEICLTDLDRMQDLLGCEKHLISAYSTFLPEATNVQLRRIFTDNMTECAQDQLAIFDVLSGKGWYPVKEAPTNEVATVRGKFKELQGKME